MPGPIVITARESVTDFAFPDAGFTVYVTVDGLSVSEVAAAGPNDFDVPKSKDAPKVDANGLTAEQLAVVLAALDKAPNDAELSSSFKKMSDLDVTLSITVTDQRAPESSPDAGGYIRFPKAEDFNQNEGFVPTSTVEIVIYGNSIDTFGPRSSFDMILAHELSHLIIDSASGKFLQDFQGNTTTYEREMETFDNLFGDFESGNYTNAKDVMVTALPGNYVDVQGTSGNNFLDASTYTDGIFHSGGGNDIIFSRDGNDNILVDGGGNKIIVDYGYGYDTLQISWLNTINDAKFAYVGYDLYITSKSSQFSIYDDPNKVILYGQKDIPGVEFLVDGHGGIMGLFGLEFNPPSYPAAAAVLDDYSLSIFDTEILEAKDNSVTSSGELDWLRTLHEESVTTWEGVLMTDPMNEFASEVRAGGFSQSVSADLHLL